MKKVISNKKLKKEMLKSINLLCDTVSSTLGPTGNNVLINKDDNTPFITNDGVTIAEAIEEENPLKNTIIEIVKEASLKTNELVGDGTTTTLVLLQKVFKEAKNVKNTIKLREELNAVLETILKEIKKRSKTPTAKELENIAITAVENNELGILLTKIFLKVKRRYAIILTESESEETYYMIKKGYNLEISKISSFYFTKDILNLVNIRVLILKGYLDSLEKIHEVLNECINTREVLIIFVEEVSNQVEEEILSYYLENKHYILIISLLEYASRRDEILKDLSFISKATIKNIDYQKVYTSDLGIIKELTINKEELTISLDKMQVKDLLDKLFKELEKCHSTYQKEFLEERLSKLENGQAIIYIGGKTKTEIREKRMRVEDALYSLEVSKGGVVYGEGITLLEIADKMKCMTFAEKIMKRVLEQPIKTIIKNSSKNPKKILKVIRKENYQKLYNFETNSFINKNNSHILDPTLVVETALKNAVSIASSLLTTNYLVINERLEKEEI